MLVRNVHGDINFNFYLYELEIWSQIISVIDVNEEQF